MDDRHATLLSVNVEKRLGSNTTLFGRSSSSLALITLLVGTLAGCGGMPDRYLSNNVGEITEDEVADKLGAPTEMMRRPDGRAEWMYRQYVSGRSQECAQYRLTFDVRKVLRDWAREEC